MLVIAAAHRARRLLAPHRSGCPQFQPPAATGRRWRSLTSTRTTAPYGHLLTWLLGPSQSHVLDDWSVRPTLMRTTAR